MKLLNGTAPYAAAPPKVKLFSQTENALRKGRLEISINPENG